VVNYDLILGILFYTFVAVFFYINRKNVDVKGKILFIYRTKLGLKAMDKIAKVSPRFLKFLGSIGIVAGFIGMIFLFGFLIYYTGLLFLRPDTPAALAPLLPGVRIPGLPVLPFWFFIISVFVVVVIHEFSHGVFARLYNLEVKNSGLIFLGPIPGAFVEPDEKKMSKASNKAQLSILSAGSFANILLFLVIFAISTFALNPFANSLLSDNPIIIQELEEGFPLDESGVEKGEKILSVNEAENLNVLSFTEFMKDTKPGDELIVKTDKREVKIVAAEHPREEDFGYIGVVVAPGNFSVFEGIVFWFARLFFWIWMISFGIGLFNWLPLFITDGGRMVYVAANRIFKNKKKAAKIWSQVNFACLLIILIQLGAYFIQLF